MIEKLLKLGPWLYALLVLSGYLHLHSYYTSFGIQIWSYLSTGELLLSFLSLSGLFVLVLVALIYAVALAYSSQLQANRYANSLVDEEDGVPPVTDDAILRETEVFFLLQYRKSTVIIYTGMVAVICGLAAYVTFYTDSVSIMPAVVGISLLMTVGVSWARMEYDRQRMLNFYFALLLVAVVPLLFAVMVGSVRANRVSHGKGPFIAEFYTDNRTYTCDSIRVYLGQTSSHMFIFDRSDSTAHVFAVDKLERFSIKEKNWEK